MRRALSVVALLAVLLACQADSPAGPEDESPTGLYALIGLQEYSWVTPEGGRFIPLSDIRSGDPEQGADSGWIVLRDDDSFERGMRWPSTDSSIIGIARGTWNLVPDTASGHPGELLFHVEGTESWDDDYARQEGDRLIGTNCEGWSGCWSWVWERQATAAR